MIAWLHFRRALNWRLPHRTPPDVTTLGVTAPKFIKNGMIAMAPPIGRALNRTLLNLAERNITQLYTTIVSATIYIVE